MAGREVLGDVANRIAKREVIGYRKRYVGLGTFVYQKVYRGDLLGEESDDDSLGDWIREDEYEALQGERRDTQQTP
mgnify:CR=1 FL=1